MFKVALVKCYHDGVFDVIGVPRLLVHDESDFSDNGVQGSEEAYSYMKHVMETALPLSIPIKVEEERGPDWGHTH
jgi:DNA polymerase I-like protein with 3'-5' exonuclease and polymerase domains